MTAQTATTTTPTNTNGAPPRAQQGKEKGRSPGEPRPHPLIASRGGTAFAGVAR